MVMVQRAASALALVTVGLSLSAKSAQAQRPAGFVKLQCQTYCSRQRINTSIARISWPSSALQQTVRGGGVLTLDMTVFARGFDQRLYASLRFESDQEPQFTRPESLAQGPAAFDVDVAGSSLDDKGRSFVTVTRLEPGVTYFWRLRAAGLSREEISTIAWCRGRVCPADLKETLQQLPNAERR